MTLDWHDDVELTNTKLEIEMPARSPDLQLPMSTEDMLAKAKEMVEATNRLEGNRANSVRRSKRKADKPTKHEEDRLGMQLQPTKS